MIVVIFWIIAGARVVVVCSVIVIPTVPDANKFLVTSVLLDGLDHICFEQLLTAESLMRELVDVIVDYMRFEEANVRKLHLELLVGPMWGLSCCLVDRCQVSLAKLTFFNRLVLLQW